MSAADESFVIFLRAEYECFAGGGGAAAGEAFPDGGSVVDGCVGGVEWEGVGGIMVEGLEWTRRFFCWLLLLVCGGRGG